MKQRLMLAVMLLTGAAAPVPAQGTPDPDSPRWQAVQALVRLAGSREEGDLDRFLEERIAPALREKVGPGALREQLRRLRDDLSGTELQGARPDGPFAAVARFGGPEAGELVIPFRLEEIPPHRFLQIAFIGAEEPAAREPLTWEHLEARLEKEAEAGFSGAVIVVRDGRTVLDRGYGLANREKQIPNRPDTIFAIGSTPIDFTRAGILLLAQQGKLDLGDPLTKYFPDVPADKRGITLRHLMTGRSGLRNFHGRPSDPNPDHTWIDRDEAMRRIFEGELLFPPGEGRRHSHSAWGVLAAVIEIVSGQSYPEFTEEHLFGPAGMADTAFFGEPYPEDRMAVGYGDDTSGEINAPPYWGPTSWLVMGSGGQVSTTGDIVRWHRALAAGKILQGEYLDRYWDAPGSLLAGGDQFGFEVLYTQGPDSMMVIMSNARGAGGMRGFEELGRELAGLVSGRGGGPAPRFSLGVMLAVDGEGVTVDDLRPGSAAERDGLRPGDLLLTANGKPLGEDPLEVLDPFLATGEAIRFEIRRGGKPMTVTVKPDPR